MVLQLLLVPVEGSAGLRTLKCLGKAQKARQSSEETDFAKIEVAEVPFGMRLPLRCEV